MFGVCGCACLTHRRADHYIRRIFLFVSNNFYDKSCSTSLDCAVTLWQEKSITFRSSRINKLKHWITVIYCTRSRTTLGSKKNAPLCWDMQQHTEHSKSVFDGNKRSVFFWLLSFILEIKRFKQWLRLRYWNSELFERYLFWLEIFFLCGWFRPKSYKFYTSLTLNLVHYLDGVFTFVGSRKWPAQTLDLC